MVTIHGLTSSYTMQLITIHMSPRNTARDVDGFFFNDFCWVYPRAFKTHPARCELRQAFHVDLDS